jgi:hypothetical protein
VRRRTPFIEMRSLTVADGAVFGDHIMLQRMDAEILFLDPKDVGPGSAVLIEHGFDVEVLDDWVDDYGPTIFIRARITTDVAEDRFLDWVVNIVEPLHGDVVEAGLSHPPQASACNRRVAFTGRALCPIGKIS